MQNMRFGGVGPMNTHQRGVYQPAMDNIPIYDLSDEEIEDEEHSRLPLLIVIALLVLAAFAGVVWLAYNQGRGRGRRDRRSGRPGPHRAFGWGRSAGALYGIESLRAVFAAGSGDAILRSCGSASDIDFTAAARVGATAHASCRSL
jgi:hypothetical protein